VIPCGFIGERWGFKLKRKRLVKTSGQAKNGLVSTNKQMSGSGVSVWDLKKYTEIATEPNLGSRGKKEVLYHLVSR